MKNSSNMRSLFKMNDASRHLPCITTLKGGVLRQGLDKLNDKKEKTILTSEVEKHIKKVDAEIEKIMRNPFGSTPSKPAVTEPETRVTIEEARDIRAHLLDRFEEAKQNSDLVVQSADLLNIQKEASTLLKAIESTPEINVSKEKELAQKLNSDVNRQMEDIYPSDFKMRILA